MTDPNRRARTPRPRADRGVVHRAVWDFLLGDRAEDVCKAYGINQSTLTRNVQLVAARIEATRPGPLQKAHDLGAILEVSLLKNVEAQNAIYEALIRDAQAPGFVERVGAQPLAILIGVLHDKHIRSLVSLAGKPRPPEPGPEDPGSRRPTPGEFRELPPANAVTER